MRNLDIREVSNKQEDTLRRELEKMRKEKEKRWEEKKKGINKIRMLEREWEL